MSETSTNLFNLPAEVELILNESKQRWLRPAEILKILSNHQCFKLTETPPCRPSAGSLYLFNRKSLRYFRNDGHRWRKKKDGKTVREAHEKLKVGSIEVLHCYYAHGEDDEDFQRRCYWMLDTTQDHIVLVHYQLAKRGHKSAISHLQPHTSSEFGSPQSSPATFAQTKSPAYKAPAFASRQNSIDWNGQSLSTETKDWIARTDHASSSLTKAILDPLSHDASFLETQVEGFPSFLRNSFGSWSAGAKFDCEFPLSLWSDVQGVKTHVCQSDGAVFNVNELLYSHLESEKVLPHTIATGDRLIIDADNETTKLATQTVMQEHEADLVSLQTQKSSESLTRVAFNTTEKEPKSKVGDAEKIESVKLKEAENFQGWMDKEIVGDCSDTLMASVSDSYWNTLGTESGDKDVSSLSHHMQLHIDLLGPSLSQEQLFSILDFSPEWAYSSKETKVIIIGSFLGSKLSHEIKWGYMFGEIEVPAEVLADNVIQCLAPLHAAGRVPFYITCRNRLACSEVREFEYCEIPSTDAFLLQDEVLQFQIRLARLLYLEPKTTLFNCSIEGCDRCMPIRTLYTIIEYSSSCDPRDKLSENLLRDRLCKWLIHKVHEESKGPDVLDNEGQGVIHIAACLGYEWAMGPIVAACGTPNFRDSQGRTALHWASYFGREGTVIALIQLGADPTAVDDPTSAFPAGRCAADLASTRGHKGLAAYLGEAFLEKLLSSLNIEQDVIHKKDSKVAGRFSVPSNEGGNVQCSLNGSHAALKKSAHAATLIQAAYRLDSFRQRQLLRSCDDISEVSFDLAALGYLKNAQRRGHHEEYLHLNTAALKIQRKYKSWKGRKEFLTMRNRIVKIQAHVRGHQVRKQYKKVVWSVGILEKIILRWRRKQAGLRGFRVGKTDGVVVLESEKSDEYEFLRISRNQKRAGVDKALARVKSMVHNEEACKQYTRLLVKFQNLQVAEQESSVLWKKEASEAV